MGLGSPGLVVTDRGRPIVTSVVFGFIIWVLVSGFHLPANRDTEEEDAIWKYAGCRDGSEWKPWRKSDRIVSVIWYWLIGLLEEHPPADSFATICERFLVGCMCIFAMPLLALPANALSLCLFGRKKGREEGAAHARGDAAPAAPPGSAALPADEVTTTGGADESEDLTSCLVTTAALGFLSILTFLWYKYTIDRKGVGAVVALLSVMIFCAPSSTFGENFVKKTDWGPNYNDEHNPELEEFVSSRPQEEGAVAKERNKPHKGRTRVQSPGHSGTGNRGKGNGKERAPRGGGGVI